MMKYMISWMVEEILHMWNWKYGICPPDANGPNHHPPKLKCQMHHSDLVTRGLYCLKHISSMKDNAVSCSKASNITNEKYKQALEDTKEQVIKMWHDLELREDVNHPKLGGFINIEDDDEEEDNLLKSKGGSKRSHNVGNGPINSHITRDQQLEKHLNRNNGTN